MHRFVCQMCGDVVEVEMDPAEAHAQALAELKRNFGQSSDYGEVCDECYRKVMDAEAPN